MERLIKGDIIVIPFPFSDLSQNKRRPACVLADLDGNDLILCQITSKTVKDGYAIGISDMDFKKGSLKKDSNIRVNKLFTADQTIALYKIGTLKETKIKEIITAVINIFNEK